MRVTFILLLIGWVLTCIIDALSGPTIMPPSGDE